MNIWLAGSYFIYLATNMKIPQQFHADLKATVMIMRRRVHDGMW